jgi:hypothetical protein
MPITITIRITKSRKVNTMSFYKLLSCGKLKRASTDEKKKEIHKRHREKNRMARTESTRLSQATAKAKKQEEDAESKG